MNKVPSQEIRTVAFLVKFITSHIVDAYHHLIISSLDYIIT